MRKITHFICACLCICALIGGAVAVFIKNNAQAEEESLAVLELWQIDSFEGGKGSRAEYLRTISLGFMRENKVYIEVTPVSADAARENLSRGIVPDMISYGSGFYGLESFLSPYGEYYSVWCRGAYCLLALGDSDFSDVTAENTVVNSGKDNLAETAALFCGLSGADFALPVGAYVSLINGEYKYLLGTQRDVIRLQTRGVDFSVMAITEFNDLYQNISVLSSDAHKAEMSRLFIEYLLKNGDGVESIGLFCDGLTLYEGAMHSLENLTFNFTVSAVVGEAAAQQIGEATRSGDINLLKSLLKSL